MKLDTPRQQAACVLALMQLCAAAAQPVTAQTPAEPAAVEMLKVRVLQGEGAVNLVRAAVTNPIVVEVRDRNERLVEGAAVTFTLPPAGPGGYFPNQALTQTVRTNYQGQTPTSGYRANTQQGQFTIRVTAVSGNQSGSVKVTQINALTLEAARAKQKKSLYASKWFWVGVAAAGTGAGLGVYYGTQGSSSGTPASSVILIPGGVVIGGPR